MKRFLLSFSIPRDSVLNFFTESCEPEAFDCPNDAQCIEDVLAGGNEWFMPFKDISKEFVVLQLIFLQFREVVS